MLGRRLAVAVAFAALTATPLAAAESDLVPHTRISITAAQWVGADGTFRHWPELEGDFTIAGDGAIRLPMVGTISSRRADGSGRRGRNR